MGMLGIYQYLCFCVALVHNMHSPSRLVQIVLLTVRIMHIIQSLSLLIVLSLESLANALY